MPQAGGIDFTTAQLQTLKAEMSNDPKGYGYNVHQGTASALVCGTVELSTGYQMISGIQGGLFEDPGSIGRELVIYGAGLDPGNARMVQIVSVQSPTAVTVINPDGIPQGPVSGVTWYESVTKADLAERLNRVRAEELINRLVISSKEIMELTVNADWVALSTTQRARYDQIIKAGTLNPGNANIIAAFLYCFPSGATHDAVVAAQKEPGSRVAVLIARGATVDQSEVARARSIAG